MKALIISNLYLALFFLASCGNATTSVSGSKSHKKDPGTTQKVAINDCIKNILYIKEQADIEKYDSINTLYFHELEEYIEPEAIQMSRQLDSVRKQYHSRIHEDEEGEYAEYLKLMDSLRQELSPYRKFVVGYAFVHTFFDGKDTVSAIFVMDTLCGFGEMTVLKETLTDDPIDNTSYSEKVKKGQTNY